MTAQAVALTSISYKQSLIHCLTRTAVTLVANSPHGGRQTGSRKSLVFSIFRNSENSLSRPCLSAHESVPKKIHAHAGHPLWEVRNQCSSWSKSYRPSHGQHLPLREQGAFIQWSELPFARPNNSCAFVLFFFVFCILFLILSFVLFIFCVFFYCVFCALYF